MNSKKAFLMYLDYEEILEDLSDEELGHLLRIIFKYEKTREEPQNLGFLMKMAFAFIKGNLNRDRQKYDKRSETSAINGKKGGRPSSKKPNEKPNEKPKKPKKPYIDIETGIDIDTDIEIDNVTVVDSISYCEEQFGRTLSPVEYQLIAKWREWFIDDIINFAIEKTIKNGARGLSYTEKIINSWHDKGFKTLRDCELENNKKKVEKAPEWFGKDIEADEASEEDVKALEDKLKNRV